jgi:hypothetical protein
VNAFVLVFKKKMKVILNKLKGSICPGTSSNKQLELFESLGVFLRDALDQNSKDPSCIRTIFMLKYAQENLILLSSLLNNNLIRVEDVYLKYSRDLINIFQNTSSQIQNISPNQYINSENNDLGNFELKKKVKSMDSRPLVNNFLGASVQDKVSKLSNGKNYLPGDSLELFRQGHLPSLRSLLEFVLTPLKKSLSNYSSDFILLDPLYQDSLHKQSSLNSAVWDNLVAPHQSKEFLKKEEIVIPLLTQGSRGIGSIAFICRSKSRESIEIYSPSDHENVHLKNSSFYFIR